MNKRRSVHCLIFEVCQEHTFPSKPRHFHCTDVLNLMVLQLQWKRTLAAITWSHFWFIVVCCEISVVLFLSSSEHTDPIVNSTPFLTVFLNVFLTVLCLCFLSCWKYYSGECGCERPETTFFWRPPTCHRTTAYLQSTIHNLWTLCACPSTFPCFDPSSLHLPVASK